MVFFRASFFGHRKVYDFYNIEREVYGIICRLIKGKEYVEFLVGRDGDFDQIVSSAVRRAKREVFDSNSSLVWVQPYLKADFRDHPEEYEAYYDAIEVCGESEVAHPKAAIQIRNRIMRSHSAIL